jgi:hypothetical protein
VIGDIKGLIAHRVQFIRRYSWVQPLLDQYAIEIPISEERFSGTIVEIAEKYRKFSCIHRECSPTPENEKSYVRDYLEGLLVVDYIYACGTEKNRRESMTIIEGVFYKNYLYNSLIKKLEPTFTSHASRDIGWAIIADYPELIWGNMLSNVGQGFFLHSPANKINFYKWILSAKGIPGMDNAPLRNAYRGMMHNEIVNRNMLSFAIHAAHSYEIGRPSDAPWQIVIKILFKRLYPKDHGARYKEYLALLDAAYPKIKS